MSLRKATLGRSGLEVSVVGLGTSGLGGVFGLVSVDEGVATVQAALQAGITLFDTAPAYGATRSEQVLGLALRGVPRGRFVLSTKAGKTTDAAGEDHFDFSEGAIRRSVDASLRRLGVDVLDIVHLHDFDREGGRHFARAMDEGFRALQAMKTEGLIRAVGAGIYDMRAWKRVLSEADLDVALVHNHHTLCDLRVFELLPLIETSGIGVINAAPFASGLLSGEDVPDWHPAATEARRRFREAAEAATALGLPLPEMALSFSCQEPRLPVTLFGCTGPEQLGRNLLWAGRRVDPRKVAAVQRLLEPYMHHQWAYDPTPSGGDRDGREDPLPW